MRLQRIEQTGIPFGKLRTPCRSPDAQIAEIAFLVKDEEVDAVVQSVAGEKIVVELGASQLFAGDHFVDQSGATARAELKRHRIAELIPIFVAAKIARRHVETDRLVEPVLARVPNVGSAKIAAQQTQHVVEDDGTRIEFGAETLEARNNVAKQAQLAAADVANNGPHAVRPAACQS